MNTFMPSASSVERKWYVIDADGLTLGRLASEVASILRGKKKPVYTKMAIKTLNDKKTFDNSLAIKELDLTETEFLGLVNKTIEWFKRF
jgi:hypothetical protein